MRVGYPNSLSLNITLEIDSSFGELINKKPN